MQTTAEYTKRGAAFSSELDFVLANVLMVRAPVPDTCSFSCFTALKRALHTAVSTVALPHQLRQTCSESKASGCRRY